MWWAGDLAHPLTNFTFLANFREWPNPKVYRFSQGFTMMNDHGGDTGDNNYLIRVYFEKLNT